MIAKAVVVGLGHGTHLALRFDERAESPTYCGRAWTADAGTPWDNPPISCLSCRAAYAAGRHPDLAAPTRQAPRPRRFRTSYGWAGGGRPR